MVDARTGRVLHEKNADARRSPASTQKLLTALLVVEAGNLDKPVVIQHSDTLAEPVKLYLKPGQVYTRRQLVQLLLVKSFNDVARALARDNAGSVEAFAVKMNQRARELGMGSSYFINPNGLTEPGQLSTARDMARLARVVYANPTLRQMVAVKEMTFRHYDGRTTVYKNTNRVLRGYAFCNGMKTGYTMAAGHCLISSGSKDGHDVIVVVLGSKKGRVWQDSYALMAWGFTL
jgi:D-alanyl-D-alanine carboxypeptidase (penicillin-binding protein 5/6)